MKIAIVLGTRPEIIKMSPIIRACEKKGIEYFILHTGQHYDYAMDQAFFDDLELPSPKYNLGVGGKEYRKQVGLMVREIMAHLEKESPDVVLVQGDTNTVLAGALAANKLRIKIAHHEAGLRSHDLTMLEETNRIITDHISDYLFTPTEDAHSNLLVEGISEQKIFHSGNTVVDAVKQNLEISYKKGNALEKFGLEKKKFILVTAHRAENVDSEKKLRGILEGLSKVDQKFQMPLIFPIHPRTSKNIESFSLIRPQGIRFVEPLGYLEFLQLEANAALILTDSGGLQEEACILEVPCVTLRENTERPETLAAKVNILAGTDPDSILSAAEHMLSQEHVWVNPFGEGSAGETIVEQLEKSCKKQEN